MIIFWSSVPAVCSKTLNLYSICCFLDLALAHFFDWTWMYSMHCSLVFGAGFSVVHLFDCNFQLFFIAITSEAICESVLLQFSSCSVVSFWGSSKPNALAHILLSISWVNPPSSSASSCFCLASGCPPRPALEFSHHNDDVRLEDAIILRMLWVPWTSQFG